MFSRDKDGDYTFRGNKTVYERKGPVILAVATIVSLLLFSLFG